MVFLSFSGGAFNYKNSESNIYMVVAPKEDYDNPKDFLEKAIKYIDEKVYPGEGFKTDYEGMHLMEGNYGAIVQHWIDSMNQSIEVKFDEVTGIQRIKCDGYDPYRDEFVIETSREYVMFLWSTTA